MRPTVWLKPGILLVFGASMDAESHQHNAVQLIVPANNTRCYLSAEGREVVVNGAAIVNAQIPHKLMMDEGWVLLVEPQSDLGQTMSKLLAETVGDRGVMSVSDHNLGGFDSVGLSGQKSLEDVIPSFAPEKIIHSWVEVKFEGRWLNLEGYIIDQAYLKKVQQSFSDQCRDFSGFGIATRCLSNPEVEWKGEDTFIQREGIADDFGVYDQPDEFYERYGSNLSGFKKLLFCYLLRHLMNWNVGKIRDVGVKGIKNPIEGECKPNT